MSIKKKEEECNFSGQSHPCGHKIWEQGTHYMKKKFPLVWVDPVSPEIPGLHS